MIERVIENWLTKVAEREFQVPFCQVLALQGHQIVHVSTHGPFEQGKDVIAVDPGGQPIAYQVKVGDISLQRWRDEVRPEIEELLDIPINHPGIDKHIPQRAVLVTTGNLSDPVRREIDDRNEARRREGRSVLETLTRGQVMQMFVEAHGGFLPADVGDLRLFLELYSRPGNYNVPKDRLSKLLVSVLPLDPDREELKTSRKELERRAASALLLSAYVLMPYEQAGNHWTAAEGWVLTAAHLLGVVERYGGNAVEASITLAKDAADLQFQRLKDEVLARESLFEASIFDGFAYRYRLIVLFGYLGGYQLWRRIAARGDWLDRRVNEFCTRYSNEVRMRGEASIPYFVAIYLYLRLSGDVAGATGLYETIVDAVARAGSKGEGLPNLNYDLETLLKAETGMLDEPIREGFRGQSYTLRALLTLAARHGHREILGKRWRQISRISCSEFFAEPAWEFFLWRAPHGTLTSSFPRQTQSWAELRETAAQLTGSTRLPAVLRGYPELALFISMVYPHRFRSDILALVDEVLERGCSTGSQNHSLRDA